MGNSFMLYPKGKNTRAWLGITCANQAERAKLLQMILDASKGWQLFDEEERKKILAQQQADLFADFGYTRSPPAKPVSNADAPDSRTGTVEPMIGWGSTYTEPTAMLETH